MRFPECDFLHQTAGHILSESNQALGSPPSSHQNFKYKDLKRKTAFAGNPYRGMNNYF